MIRIKSTVIELCIPSTTLPGSSRALHSCSDIFFNFYYINVSFLFFSPKALVVNFEADSERRKLGLPHRVNFLGRSSLEPEYTQTEEVELHRQRHPVCTTAIFQLHVSNWKHV